MNEKTELALLNAKITELEGKVDALTAQMKDLLEAWQTATGLLKVIKWLAGLASAGAVVVATYKGFK